MLQVQPSAAQVPAVIGASNSQCISQFAGTISQFAGIRRFAPPLGHQRDTSQRLDCPDQYGVRLAIGGGNNIHCPTDSV